MADLRPRSRKIFGCGGGGGGAERLRRGKTPANQRVGGAFHVQKIFGGFRVALTAFAVKLAPETGSIQGAFSAYAIRYFTLRTKRNYVRFAHFVTAFHPFPIPYSLISLDSLSLFLYISIE